MTLWRNPLYVGVIFVGFLLTKALWVQLDISNQFFHGAMMDCSSSTMSYQALRDSETGPPQYRSRTVYEDANPEMLWDFFWDDEFRAEWDHMLIKAETLEENVMMVQCFHSFAVIGSCRIWDLGRSYYCVTKVCYD
ncbi:hypothetical protein LIER_36683 [Lithospermum erythrorhizon]|uniref:START domain-containing protein n=1 Tax=Lithospermum erythrorhizon TaxID=34254 RepID=A0AAV3P9Z4_LITER